MFVSQEDVDLRVCAFKLMGHGNRLRNAIADDNIDQINQQIKVLRSARIQEVKQLWIAHKKEVQKLEEKKKQWGAYTVLGEKAFAPKKKAIKKVDTKPAAQGGVKLIDFNRQRQSR